MGVESGFTITGPGGWLLVRALTLAYALVISVGTYSRWTTKISWNKNLYKWMILWAVCTQLMASFYIAEWCNGNIIQAVKGLKLI